MKVCPFIVVHWTGRTVLKWSACECAHTDKNVASMNPIYKWRSWTNRESHDHHHRWKTDWGLLTSRSHSQIQFNNGINVRITPCKSHTQGGIYSPVCLHRSRLKVPVEQILPDSIRGSCCNLFYVEVDYMIMTVIMLMRSCGRHPPI